MSMQTLDRNLEREDVGAVTVLRLTAPRLLDDKEIVALFEGMVRLVAESGRRQLVLDLRRAELLASLVLGKLVMLNRRVQAAGGRLALCGLPRLTAEELAVMRLAPLFHIYEDEPQACQSFGEQVGSSGKSK